METLTAFYFSGTGNTRYLSEYLLKKLSSCYRGELISIEEKSDFAKKISSSDLLLFAFPVYGSSPPIPMRNFVYRFRSLWKGKRVLLLESQYFFSGDGAASLGRALKRYGAKIEGAEIFNMPNNLSDVTLFPIKNGKEIRKTLERAKRRADRFAERIKKGRAKKRGFSLFSHGVGYFSQRMFWRRKEQEKRARLKIDGARCVGCGICVKNCPAGNLSLQGKRAISFSSCVLCYRCVNLCPKQAISLIGSNPPKVQYKGPN